MIFFILLADFILSNTVLSYKNCLKYEKFYYELKKNCKGKYRFKKTFPIVETITDNMGLRVGKDSLPKNKDKKNIFISSKLAPDGWSQVLYKLNKTLDNKIF